MKKTVVFLFVSALTLLSASVYAAKSDALATVVNVTNCSCQGMYPNYNSCQLLPASKGVVIQPIDGNSQPYGPQLAVGSSGQAPIYAEGSMNVISVLEVSNYDLGSFENASAGATYYVVMSTFPGSSTSLLSISDHNPCK